MPPKPEGPVLLILDGHSSHTTNFEMLEYTEEKEIVLLCLSSHSTQALQPLDMSFFKPLKDYFKQVADTFMFSNKDKIINKDVAGKLIGTAWKKVATISNSTSGFLATGIYPYNRDTIPDYFYQISDSCNKTQEIAKPPDKEIEFLENNDNYLFVFEDTENCSGDRSHYLELEEEIRKAEDLLADDQNKCSTENRREEPKQIDEAIPSTSTYSEMQNKTHEESSSKHLHDIAPIPQLPCQEQKKKQNAKVLSSKNLTASRNKKKLDSGKVRNKSKIKETSVCNKKRKNRSEEEKDDPECAECLETYYMTTEDTNWIKCISCQKWLHETCTMYNNK